MLAYLGQEPYICWRRARRRDRAVSIAHAQRARPGAGLHRPFLSSWKLSVLSQQNISATTPCGATIVAGGVTFRVWVPRAQAVYLNPVVAADGSVQPNDAQLMSNDASGY